MAVRVLLEHLKVPHEFIYVKYYEGESLGEAFGKVKIANSCAVIRKIFSFYLFHS